MEDPASTGPDNETSFETIYDAEGRLRQDWYGALRSEIEAGDVAALGARMAPLHESETGDVIDALPPDERVRLVMLLGDDFDYSALTEVDDSVRIELMEELPNAHIARGVADLDSDDAVYILEDLDKEDRDEILEQMPAFDRISL